VGASDRHRKYLPYAFTEQGVAMLSSVLRSKRAIAANVQIMRAFVRMRELLSSNRELAEKLDQLERKLQSHDETIVSILKAIRELMRQPHPSSRLIGFTAMGRRALASAYIVCDSAATDRADGVYPHAPSTSP
jgi:hypothetical protein